MSSKTVSSQLEPLSFRAAQVVLKSNRSMNLNQNDSEEQWVEIQIFPSRIEAELAKTALETARIPVKIQADDQGGFQPSLSLVHGVKLKVPTSYVDEARSLLALS